MHIWQRAPQSHLAHGFEVYEFGQCVRVYMDMSEWFPANVGLRQGCVMSPWLFNVYMDGVVREVKGRCLEKGLNC